MVNQQPMSSLQLQLTKIRDPAVNRLKVNHDRYKDSFIFSAKEAADQDFASIFSIGKEGFVSLCQLNHEFKKFETALFSEAAQNIDRVLLTKEENDELNQVIETFLVYLSPFFLISSAGKAIEWLVRRFRINEFNVESILRCIFPYHDSPLFLKMLSILHLRPDSNWSPLIAVRKSKSGLSQTQLVRWLVRDPALLSFFVKTTENGSSRTPHFNSLFSFFSSVMLLYLQELPSLEDHELRIILPSTLKGLKSRCEDYKLSCFMIFLLISSRVSLSKEITDIFVKRVISNEFKFNLALTSLIRVSHSQTQNFNKDNVNPELVHWFCAQKDALSLLAAISQNHDTSFFVSYLLWNLLAQSLSSNEVNADILDFAKQIADQPSLANSSIVTEFCQHLFKLIAANSLEVASELGKFFPILERQESDIVQSLISQELQKIGALEGKDSKKYIAFYSILVGQLQDSLSVPLKETNTTLTLSLIHPDTRYQLAALLKLNELLKTHDVSAYSAFFPVLLNMLCSPELQLVEAAVSLFSENPSLVNAIPSEQLWELVQKLPQDLKKVGFQFTLTSDFVGSYFSKYASVFAESLILTPTNTETHFFVCNLLSKSDKLHSVLLPRDFLSKKAIKSSSFSAISKRNQNYINLVSDAITKSNSFVEELRNLADLCLSIQSTSTQLIYVLVLSLAVKKVIEKRGTECLEDFVYTFGKVIRTILPHDESISFEENGSFEDGINTILSSSSTAELSQASLVTASIAISQILMPLKEDYTFDPWLLIDQNSKNAGVISILTAVFDIICSRSLSTFPLSLSLLIEKYVKTNEMAFFCRLSLCNTVSLHTRAKALILLSVYISKRTSNSSNVSDFQLCLPFIFLSLSHDEEIIRTAGIVCLEAINSTYSKILKSKLEVSTVFGLKELYGSPQQPFKYLNINAASYLVKFYLDRQLEILLSSQNFQAIFIMSLSQNLPKTSNKTRDSTSLSTQFLSFVLSHVSSSNHLVFQVPLLKLLSSVDDKIKLRSLSRFFSQSLQKYRDVLSDSNAVDFFTLLFGLFTPTALSSLDSKSPRYVNILLYAIGIHETISENTTISQLALGSITPALYSVLSQSSQTLIVKALISLGTSDFENAASLSKKLLCELPLESGPLEEIVQDLQSLFVLPSLPAKKSKSHNNISVVEFVQPLSQLTLLLEALDAHNDYSIFVPLSPGLFGFLTQLEEVSIRPSTTATNYVYQLLLSVLTGIFTSAYSKSLEINEASTKIDLVVQLLQLQAQPQTHHQALRLISSIATMIPQKVLGFIMPIFTFMGSNVLKKDDNYSFFIIQETLEKIVPPLLASYRQDTMDDATAQNEAVLHSKPLISVFVNALLKIPQHRRVKLFTILVSTMGQDSLYGVLGVILEIYATHHAQGNRDDASKLKEFCAEIIGQFQPVVQVKALGQLLDSIVELPNEKPKVVDSSSSALRNIYSFGDHSEKHLRHYKFAIISLVREACGRKAFLHQLLEIEANSKDAKLLDDSYICLAERLLLLADIFREHLADYSRREDSSSSTTKFFTQLVGFVYDVLNDIVNLLSLPCFTMFIKKLLVHQRSTIRFRSIQLLETKLEAYHSQMSVDEVQAFLALVPTLSNLVSNDSEAAINRQNALNCIGVYLQCFSSHHGITEDKLFIESVVPLLLGESGLGSTNWLIYASSCHTASYICQELSLSFVKYIPTFIPLLLSQIEKSYLIDNESTASTVWLSELVLIESIFSKLAKFTGPYLSQIVTQLITFKAKLAERTNDLSLTARVNSLVDMLHSKLEARVMLPILFKLYDSISSMDKKSLEIFFEITSNVVISLSQEGVEKLYILLFKFYIECFDFRQKQSKFSPEEVEEIEDVILQSFVLLVMKLRDDMFKPVFLKLSEWASQESTNANVGKSRLVVFYHLIDMMLSKLKHIFAPYFIYILDNCMDTLNMYDSDSDCDQLWKYLLRSLTFSLQYDSEGIWTSETSGKLLPILLKQAHVASDLDVANTWLVPCFVWLCSAVTSESSWKNFNQQVALMTRDEDSKVRCISLCILRSFYLRQKENFLSLLPETIPFLAEVMEDDTEEVVKCTRDLVITIERFNGESLDQYFR